MNANDTPRDEGYDIALQPRQTDWAMAFFGLTAFFAAVLWGGVLAQLITYVPRSRRVFDDFKLLVPETTSLVIHHAWWLVPVLIFATLVVCVTTRSRWSWLFLLVALPLVLNAVIFLSLFLPTQNLLEGLRR